MLHDRTLDGKPFHTVGAATEKARVASAVCVRGTVSSGASEDRIYIVMYETGHLHVNI